MFQRLLINIKYKAAVWIEKKAKKNSKNDRRAGTQAQLTKPPVVGGRLISAAEHNYNAAASRVITHYLLITEWLYTL